MYSLSGASEIQSEHMARFYRRLGWILTYGSCESSHDEKDTGVGSPCYYNCVLSECSFCGDLKESAPLPFTL